LRPLAVFEEDAERKLTWKSTKLKLRPEFFSRIGGVLYLIIIVGGIFGEAFVRNRLIAYYNRRRRHSALRNQAPLVYLAGLGAGR
jgi:hypothetical protein